ncbi:MAG: glucose-6-phosphate dehydrogenase [Aerococcus sp.]|nr:glucose-6-phosphate dehydrogenase [Aerococcus sp.]
MSQTQPRQSGLIVLFGATGDLASRKLYPAIYQLYHRHLLSKHFAVIGTARREWDDDYFRQVVADALKKAGIEVEEKRLKQFQDHFYYVANDATKEEHFTILKEKMQTLKEKFSIESRYLYYLSIAPNLFDVATKHLKSSGIMTMDGTHRVLLEKPFGHDRTSAKALNDTLAETFSNEDIYRIDHYIGKETVQNIWFLRRFNPMIEGIWNYHFIDHVQVTLSENLPVGSRGGYYDDNGALLDMFQNHILQVMSFVGMDLPQENTASDLHAKKVAFLRSLPTLSMEQVQENIVRGQYDQSKDGKRIAYRDEEQVDDDSLTETYVAGRLTSHAKRWQGVPFYFRTGKNLSAGKYTTVELIFKSDGDLSDNPSRLSFVITPELGARIVLNQKEFGTIKSQQVMPFWPDQDVLDSLYTPESYESIIYCALRGDKTIFSTIAEIEEQWRITDSIESAWEAMPAPDFPNYPALSTGPKAADDLLKRDGRQWIYEPQWETPNPKD